MAGATATWRYRGHPGSEQPAVLVQFSNGRLQRTGSMRFIVYRNRDTAHPRKKHRRILVSETERLSYVGNNFGSGAMKCNSLCRYFIGVLDKDSGQMEVYNAEIFNMQPLLSDNLVPDDTKDYQNKSYREKMDLCIEAFGTSKQKRALNSRRMNAVGSDILNTAVTKAAANIIDAKGVTALIQDVAQDDVQNISTFLPPCNEDANKPENVYKFEDILSPAEYEALRIPAAAFVNITPEEITKKTQERSHCCFVLEELKFLPANEKSRDHKARCLWFLDTLIKFSYQKVIKTKYPMGPECPQIISRKLMKHFTSLTYNNSSVQNLISASMKAKITAYVIALALHINNFQIDLTVLQNDLKLQESRMMDIAKAMRLKVSKAKGLPEFENDQNHKLGTLSLPLPMQKASGNQKKRKKMN
ncbi:DNA-directed RNA polymerase I subunit RPA49 [Pezoporus wallicus]|uniref:DNA-directed RNA polymerase I subunit RPA49 n=1 Tax=Pezoporus wallicus TaxID=35540 RepID=UPI0025515CF2|nr:DNA-directed RNA polymerase I subunit RPA49 [Pezoporus wallicus]XP_061301341.1 DNA-directed RNA polymerase I subunit RPA49 [Pezoporus flaviventris]